MWKEWVRLHMAGACANMVVQQVGERDEAGQAFNPKSFPRLNKSFFTTENHLELQNIRTLFGKLIQS